MFKIVLRFSIFLLLSSALAAKSEMTQSHVLSLSPVPSTKSVSADTIVEIKYDLSIIESSIKKNTIVVKSNHKKVKGSISIKDSYTIAFIPDEDLPNGKIHIKIKPIKLFNTESEVKSSFEKFTKKMCSFFYDDLKECPLCQYRCSVKTKKIKYSLIVNEDVAKVVSLELSKTDMEFNIEATEDITITAIYDDNSTKDITSDVQWSMSDNSILSIQNNTIIPLKDGAVTLQATYNAIESAPIHITVYKEINGYRLPPEPDETLNNSTLLGIDVNANGVRDDVERKVIETYKEPIKIELMMAANKVAQKILENPVSLAQEYQKEFTKVSNCSNYLEDVGVSIDAISNVDFVQDNTYNTNQRVRAYIDYNIALSGGVYGTKISDWNAEACDFFDVEQMLKDIK